MYIQNGWAQIDTSQDASYFGTWTNPFTFETINYCEGDIYHTKCDTVEEYALDIRKSQSWNNERGYKFAIDGMCNEKLIARFKEIGLGDLLH